MIRRDIYSQLEAHLGRKQVTVITGMRRVGKSTALLHLIRHSGLRNVLMLDFERIENRILFNQPSYTDIERGLAALGLDLQQPGILALDEIQLVPNSPSVIKSLYDTWGLKIIATGSSSFYLRNQFAESLAGRKQIFEMRPLSFPEYVRFQGEPDEALEAGRRQPFLLPFFDRWKALYETYLRYGGFPEVALSDSPQAKTDFLKDILNSYINLDIRLLSDFSASDTLYKLIAMLAVRSGSKLDLAKLSSLIGINRNKVKDYLHLLEHTYFIQMVRPFTGGLDKALSKQPKCYFADTGLLQVMGQVSSGQAFENAIANQLLTLGEVNYFQRSNGMEIDFILNRQVAIEVKETPGSHDLATLQQRAQALGLEQCWLVGRQPPPSGFQQFWWGGSLF